MKSKKRIGPCTYCGRVGPLTRDHVPSKSLFPKPRPDLITVPCCDSCQATSKKDEDYFRTVLTIRRETEGHPAAKQVQKGVLRAFRDPKQAGFSRSFLRTMRQVQRRTPAGIYLGPTGQFTVQPERIQRVVARTVRGLHMFERRVPLPVSAEIMVRSEEDLRALPQDLQTRLRSELIAALFRQPPRVIGADEIFAYWVAQQPGRPDITAWILRYYVKVGYLVFVTPNAEPGGATADP